MAATILCTADREEIHKLIQHIEDITGFLLNNQMEEYNASMQTLSQLLTTTFPTVIASYSNERLQDYAADAGYWPGQIERIIDALKEDDRFKIIDVLYYETRENLMNYLKIIDELETGDESDY